MRLFLLPISTRRTLIYSDRATRNLKPGQKPPLIERVTNKAAELWASYERAPSGWKKKLTTYGNLVLRRIPYEEWGLKTIPSLSKKRKETKLSKQEKVEVLFPGQFLSENRVPEVLRQLAVERQPLHRKRMIWSLIGAPLTLPFALVPIIPNIPGFYLLFRGWSHWRGKLNLRIGGLTIANLGNSALWGQTSRISSQQLPYSSFSIDNTRSTLHGRLKISIAANVASCSNANSRRGRSGCEDC